MSLLAHGVLAGLDEISEVGRDPGRGGYSRHLWEPADLELRNWFIERATRIGLDCETDRNGNIWAWWGASGPDAVVVGSHLDSVPGGGAYDGPLGVVSALDAVAALKAENFTPSRPVAVVAFAEEEGSRFGVACLGSGLMTGQLDPSRVLALSDRDGVRFADAAATAGLDPDRMGADTARVADIGLFIELHVEQGRGLIDLESALAVASSILAHGRWRARVTGQGDHAGATPMASRRDPVVAAAAGILAVRDIARVTDGARATVGQIAVIPGGTNVIASAASFSIDARAETDGQVRELVSSIIESVTAAAADEGCTVDIAEESWASAVRFDPGLRDAFATSLGDVPRLPSGAGHDAGILAAVVPSAMLFVRNPTGISHSPEEFAEVADCVAGVHALTNVLRGVL